MLRRSLFAALAIFVVTGCGGTLPPEPAPAEPPPAEPADVRELVLVGVLTFSPAEEVLPPPVLIVAGITFAFTVRGGTLSGRPDAAECDYQVTVRESSSNSFTGSSTFVDRDQRGRVACKWTSEWEAEASIPLKLSPTWTVTREHYFARR